MAVFSGDSTISNYHGRPFCSKPKMREEARLGVHSFGRSLVLANPERHKKQGVLTGEGRLLKSPRGLEKRPASRRVLHMHEKSALVKLDGPPLCGPRLRVSPLELGCGGARIGWKGQDGLDPQGRSR